MDGLCIVGHKKNAKLRTGRISQGIERGIWRRSVMERSYIYVCVCVGGGVGVDGCARALGLARVCVRV